MLLDLNTSTLYVANYCHNSVSIINTTSDNITCTVSVGARPVDIALAQNNRLLVLNKFSNSVSIINTTGNDVMKTVSVGCIEN